MTGAAMNRSFYRRRMDHTRAEKMQILDAIWADYNAFWAACVSRIAPPITIQSHVCTHACTFNMWFPREPPVPACVCARANLIHACNVTGPCAIEVTTPEGDKVCGLTGCVLMRDVSAMSYEDTRRSRATMDDFEESRHVRPTISIPAAREARPVDALAVAVHGWTARATDNITSCFPPRWERSVHSVFPIAQFVSMAAELYPRVYQDSIARIPPKGEVPTSVRAFVYVYMQHAAQHGDGGLGKSSQIVRHLEESHKSQMRILGNKTGPVTDARRKLTQYFAKSYKGRVPNDVR
jgi:hypothetical protein